MRRLIKVFLLLIVIGAIAALTSRELMSRYLESPLVLDSPINYEIEAGRGLGSVARELAGMGVLDRPSWLLLHARMTNRSNLVKAGEYELAPGETPASMLDRFVSGRVVLHSLTVIEGWTFSEMLELLSESPEIDADVETMSNDELMSMLRIAAQSPEGWFFPDTYRFARGTAASELLVQGVRRMQTELAESWSRRAPGLVIETEYDALVLASIIERETALDSERRKISGVFHRRLQKGMRLQTDPTVIYGLGDSFDGDLRRRDLETDTPYNTYTRHGLPPTPISLPGKASIDAAVDPIDGNALYFVATGDPDGSHYFSATLEEHNRAVQRYLKKLRSRDGG